MQHFLIRVSIFLWLCGVTLSTTAGKEQVLPRVAANNAAALRQHTGKEVTVFGKVNRATVSRSGHHFLNFYSSNLSLVCFKEHVAKFPAGGPAKQWKDREIEVTGKLETYKGKPQIKLTTPSQIRAAGDEEDGTEIATKRTFSLNDIRVDGPADGSQPGTQSKYELKQIGDLTWVSPAGLIYRGKDAAGLTRVEHVLRHAVDQPQRRGSHGVFDGDKDQALATVDEAWKRAKSKKIRPQKEGDRLAYTIPMGRRVGYLGGSTGARRKHPALKRVFIVIRGKSEVITAFPK